MSEKEKHDALTDALVVQAGFTRRGAEFIAQFWERFQEVERQVGVMNSGDRERAHGGGRKRNGGA